MRTIFRLFVLALAVLSAYMTARNYEREENFAGENKKSTTTVISFILGYDREEFCDSLNRACVARLKPMSWAWVDAPEGSRIYEFLVGWSKIMELIVLTILFLFAFKRTNQE